MARSGTFGKLLQQHSYRLVFSLPATNNLRALIEGGNVWPNIQIGLGLGLVLELAGLGLSGTQVACRTFGRKYQLLVPSLYWWWWWPSAACMMANPTKTTFCLGVSLPHCICFLTQGTPTSSKQDHVRWLLTGVGTSSRHRRVTCQRYISHSVRLPPVT